MLKFRQLEIENFGPYAGRQVLDLHVTDEAPVVIIHGENTLGKTQLFAALRWCLYGTFHASQTVETATREIVGRLNRPAARDGATELHVALSFTNGENEFLLRRHAKFLCGTAVVNTDLRRDTAVIPASAVAATIGGLLHPQISEFFLFDAETMQRFYDRLNDKRQRDFIRESVEQVLGVPALQLAHRDVGDLANDALQRQAKTLKAVDDSNRIRLRLKSLSDEEESLNQSRKEMFEDLSRAEEELKEVRERMKAVGGLEADMREQETLMAQIRDSDREEDELRAQQRDILSGGWMAPAQALLAQALMAVRSRNSLAVQHQAAMSSAKARVDVLRDQGSGGTCPTCRQTLPSPGPEHLHELADAEAAWAQLVAQSGGSSDVDLVTERKVGALQSAATASNYKDLSKRLDAIALTQYERRRNLSNIADRLQGHKVSDVRALGQKQAALDASLDSLRSAIKKDADRRAEIATEQQKFARQLGKVTGADPSVVFEAGFYQYIRELLAESIASYRGSVRASVEGVANESFLSLIRDPQGYGGLKISDDYQVTLVDLHGNDRPTSEGGKQLLALSLIGALKRAAVRGGPVVIDSPLGRLDLDHRANVLQTWIPSLASQSILLVQSGELTVTDARRLLGTTLGREYILRRPDNDPEVVHIEVLED